MPLALHCFALTSPSPPSAANATRGACHEGEGQTDLGGGRLCGTIRRYARPSHRSRKNRTTREGTLPNLPIMVAAPCNRRDLWEESLGTVLQCYYHEPRTVSPCTYRLHRTTCVTADELPFGVASAQSTARRIDSPRWSRQQTRNFTRPSPREVQHHEWARQKGGRLIFSSPLFFCPFPGALFSFSLSRAARPHPSA